VVVAGAAAGVAVDAAPVVAGAAAGTAAASGLDSCLADWQPTTKRIVTTEISDPHDHKVKRLAWFIYFRFYFWRLMTGFPILQRRPFSDK
jgi:hypothetical protein